MSFPVLLDDLTQDELLRPLFASSEQGFVYEREVSA